MINVVVIQGRLVADPELKTTPTGTSVTSFRVAVDKRFPKENEEKANFFNIVAWKQTAEFVTRYFHKGSMIAIDGYLDERNYTDKNGNKRNVVEIIADQVSFCGSKETNANAFVSTNDNVKNDSFVSDDDDELPF